LKKRPIFLAAHHEEIIFVLAWLSPISIPLWKFISFLHIHGFLLVKPCLQPQTLQSQTRHTCVPRKKILPTSTRRVTLLRSSSR
jgi:hypothetical protein